MSSGSNAVQIDWDISFLAALRAAVAVELPGSQQFARYPEHILTLNTAWYLSKKLLKH